MPLPEDYVRFGWHVVPRDLPIDPVRIGWYNVPRDKLLSHDVRVGWLQLTPDLFGGTGRPRITSATSAGGTVGVPFSYHITATNSPTNFGATGLPPGLSVNTTTGEISGTPTAQGTSGVTISATNTEGTSSRSLSIQIAAAGLPPAIISDTSVSGTVNVAFSHQVTATGSPTSFAATGLPTGLSINASTGLISGTPTSTGTTTAQVTATNAYGTSAPHSLSIAIGAAVVIPQAFYGALPNGTTVVQMLDADFIRGLPGRTNNPAAGTVLTAPVPATSQGVCFAFPANLGTGQSCFQTPPGFDVLVGLLPTSTTMQIPPGAPDSTPIEYRIIYQRTTAAYSSAVEFKLTI